MKQPTMERLLPVEAKPEEAEGESKRATQVRNLLRAFARARLKEEPTKIEDPESLESVMEFIRAGGRLPAIHVLDEDDEDVAEGLRKAEQYLDRDMFSEVSGREWPRDIRFDSDHHYYHPEPNRPDCVGGKIYPLLPQNVDAVMAEVAARKAEDIPGWDGEENLDARIEVLDRAMAMMWQDRHTFAGLLALSGGKNDMEIFRDLQELFDFARNYRLVEHEMNKQQDVLRSKGNTSWGYRAMDKAVGIWQPFNFACIGIGEAIAALIAGNTVVIHTSARAVGPYKWAYEKLKAAGVPVGRMHFIIPDGDDASETGGDPEMSKRLAEHDDLGNIYATGSSAVMRQLQATQVEKNARQKRLDLQLHAEAGGYNPLVVLGLPDGAMESLTEFFAELSHDEVAPSGGDWDRFLASLPKDSFLASFAEALVDSACGLQGHKCSALSRVIVAVGEGAVSRSDADMLKRFAIEVMNRVEVGDVVENPGVRMGSLIDEGMHKKVRGQVQKILDRGGRILTGDGHLAERMSVDGLPSAMRPIIYEDPNWTPEDGYDEIFAPVFGWVEVDGRKAAIQNAWDIHYALTLSVVDATTDGAKEAREQLPHGVAYVSGKGYVGPTTAAPASDIAFHGYKASGTGSEDKSPGTARRPLAFMQQYPRVNVPRCDWEKELGDPNGLARSMAAVLALYGMRVDLAAAVDEVVDKKEDPC